MEYIDKYSSEDSTDAEVLFVLKTDCLEYGQLINFIELAKLKEEIDQLYSDEQSRLLSLSLLGDLTCDGCTI